MSGSHALPSQHRAARAAGAGAVALLGSTALAVAGSTQPGLALPLVPQRVTVDLYVSTPPTATPSATATPEAATATTTPPTTTPAATAPAEPTPTVALGTPPVAVPATAPAAAADVPVPVPVPESRPPSADAPPVPPPPTPPPGSVPAAPVPTRSSPVPSPTAPAEPAPVQDGAAPPAGTLTVQQSQAVAGRAGATAVLRWTSARPLSGHLRVGLPAGWTPPAEPGSPGAVVVAGGTCSVRVPPLPAGRSVTTSVVCPAAGTLLLRYAAATAPTSAGDHALAVHTRADGVADWTELPAPPVLRVVPAGLATLTFVSQPSGGHAGEPLPQDPVLVGVDDFGNAAVGTVRLGLRGDDDGLEGELVRPLVDGQVSFRGLRLRSAGHEQRLVAVAGPVLEVSDPFLVTGGQPAALSFRTAGVTASSGAPLRPAPVLQVRDAQGHGVPAAAEVTVRLLDAPPGTRLSGTTTVRTDGGRAPLPDLVVTGPPGRARLVAEAPGLAPSPPLPVEVTADPTGAAGTGTAALSALSGTVAPLASGVEAVLAPLVAPVPVLPALPPGLPAALLPLQAPQIAAPGEAPVEAPTVARALDRRAASGAARAVDPGAGWLALLAAGTALLLRARRGPRRRARRTAG